MKTALLALVACLALSRAALQEPFEGPEVDAAKELIIASQRQDEMSDKQIADKCNAELSAASAFFDDLDETQAVIKKEQSGTFANSVKELKTEAHAQIKRLLELRARLGRHVDRVNRVFSAMHDESMADVESATAMLKNLGAVLQTHDSFRDPAVDPIVMDPHPLAAHYSVDDAEAKPAKTEAPAKEEPASAPAPAFLDISSRAVSALVARQTEIDRSRANEFIDAYRNAVQLYNGAIEAWRNIKKLFEEERAALTTFRDLLDSVIHLKHKRFMALEESAEEMTASLKENDKDLQVSRDTMKDAVATFKGACNDAARVHDFFTEQRAHLLADIEGGVPPAATAEAEANAEATEAEVFGE
mmetsp:Transcript_1342/g.3948  ORF Transcript_1342/g.3948 Transcript_1342/m.3948 type:complete len:359 (+) Transcript_1342:38-1114(+)